jgi:putative oxidoreductase
MTGGERALRIALWVLQVVLGLFFMMVGYSHSLAQFDEVAKQAEWMLHVPRPLSLFIGYAELAGGLGLILPAATRFKPWLTPLAALGIGTIMTLATIFHVVRGEAAIIAFPVVSAALSLFVAWGRWRKAPIVGR